MGRRDNKKRDEQPEPAKWSNEIIGIILGLLGAVLLLSLISYSPADLPQWGLLEPFADKGGKPRANFIGSVGGVLGFSLILLFGAAACLIPVACLWFGVVKMMFNGRLWPRCVTGFALLVVAGACFLHAANWLFIEWALRCKIGSPGGVIGSALGGAVLSNVIGTAGTLLLCGTVYLMASILLTGHAPVLKVLDEVIAGNPADLTGELKQFRAQVAAAQAADKDKK